MATVRADQENTAMITNQDSLDFQLAKNLIILLAQLLLSAAKRSGEEPQLERSGVDLYSPQRPAPALLIELCFSLSVVLPT
jgi:hypothetical protein